MMAARAEETPDLRHITDEAIEVVPADAYRGPAWRRVRHPRISASEIAAVLGIAPWSSPFDLWWRKSGARDDTGSGETRDTWRGTKVEHLVLADFRREHPEFRLRTHVGYVVNEHRPWQGFTPDGLACEGPWVPVADVQTKTAQSADAWGTPGTDEVPVHVRAQVIYEMDVLGPQVRTAYVPVWVGFSYREYVVEYDEEDALLMREAARAFLDTVEAGGPPPPVDGHPATLERLKRLHPCLVDDEVPIPADLIREHETATRWRDHFDRHVKLIEAEVRDRLGDVARGVILSDPDPDGNQRVAKAVSRSIYPVRESVRPATQVDRLFFSAPKTVDRNLRPTPPRRRKRRPTERTS